MTTRESLACAGLASGVLLALGAGLGTLAQWWPAALGLGLVVLLVEAE